MGTALISAVILYFRLGPEFAATVDSVISQTLAPDEVLVVDNASGDGVAATTVSSRSATRLLSLDRNRGYAGGMNAGLAEVSPDARYVLLVTHDVVLAPDCVERLVAEAEMTPEAAVLAPLLGFRGQAETVFSAGGALSGRRMENRHIGSGEPLDRWRSRPTATVDWVDGSVQLVSSEALKRVGRFDEDYFVYWEEVAFHTRARRLGWDVLRVKGAVAWQQPGDYRLYYRTRNRLRYLFRHAPKSVFLLQFLLELEQLVKTRREIATRVRALFHFVIGYGGPENTSLRAAAHWVVSARGRQRMSNLRKLEEGQRNGSATERTRVMPFGPQRRR